ncbi:MAG: DsbA family protein [Paracoccaceae bacterium]
MFIYGYDPVCGWCYGAIPALRHLRATLPALPIEVLPGGLVTGERIGPYAKMEGYIKGASENLRRVTGQAPSEAFYDLIRTPGVTGSSMQPSDAVIQMKAAAPDRAFDYAHALQEAHFRDGRDLNDPATHAELTGAMGLPAIETAHWDDPAELEARCAPTFARARAMGVSSFPSFLVVEGGRGVDVGSIYDGERLVEAVRAAQAQLAA